MILRKVINIKSLSILFIIAIGGVLFFVNRKERALSGYIFDCMTNMPIKNAEIIVQQSGWGTSQGQVVWDKTYKNSAVSDEKGYFKIPYSINSSVNIKAIKDDYFIADQWDDPKQAIIVKILKKDKEVDSKKVSEPTNYCKPISECMSNMVVDGVMKSKNVCTSY